MILQTSPEPCTALPATYAMLGIWSSTSDHTADPGHKHSPQLFGETPPQMERPCIGIACSMLRWAAQHRSIIDASLKPGAPGGAAQADPAASRDGRPDAFHQWAQFKRAGSPSQGAAPGGGPCMRRTGGRVPLSRPGRPSPGVSRRVAVLWLIGPAASYAARQALVTTFNPNGCSAGFIVHEIAQSVRPGLGQRMAAASGSSRAPSSNFGKPPDCSSYSTPVRFLINRLTLSS
jgi:hypothetical protein